MRFEESKYAQLNPYSKIEFRFGDFYFCDQFVVSELHEGIHFNWDKILEVVGAALDYYGENVKIAYVANRIDSYSIEPQLWYRFHTEFNSIIAIAAVAYSDIGYQNATLEKRFAKMAFKRCEDLSTALDWVQNLKEFNQN